MKPVSDDVWVPQIADRLLALLPRSQDHPDRVDPGSVPAFHHAVRMLERLGFVEISDDAIRLSDQPGETAAKLRWDDAYHTFLHCLEEMQLIDYSPVAREAVVAYAESFGVAAEELDPALEIRAAGRIAGSAHTCDALVDSRLLGTLETIGLVASGRWTGPAIPILWRKWANKNPDERPGDTALFRDRVDAHATSIPARIVAELDETLSIPEDLLARKRRMLAGRDDEGEVWRQAGLSRMMDLEFLLSQNWRFTDGWLTSGQRSDCLFFGFDSLASEFAHALVAGVFPDSDVARTMRQTSDVRPDLH